MIFDLPKTAKEKVIIVAHRGTFGGNIPCNVIPSFETALKQGADMIEIDVDMSVDGKLFIFHPGKESEHLGVNTRIEEMKSEEIKKLRYLNYDRTETQFGLNTLDELLETFKGRCYINVDKFWGYPKEIYEEIKKHNMQEQVLVKSKPSKKVLSVLNEIAPELPYMSVVHTEHPMHETLMKSNLNYIGAEVIFESEDEEVASDEFIARMHKDNKLLWVNSIIYDYKQQLTAGHSDDTALCTSSDDGWGWLVKKGYDIIQTDWPIMLKNYLSENNMLYK